MYAWYGQRKNVQALQRAGNLLCGLSGKRRPGRGGGSSVKIINNYIAFTTQVVNGEALLTADTLGIPTELFYQVTTSSSGSNKILNAKKKKVLTGDLKPGFAPDLVVKDLELARQLCQDMKVPNFTLNTVLQYFLRNYSSRNSSSNSFAFSFLHTR